MDSKTTPHHGTREVRLEDDALVRGAGRFIDDARYPKQAFAVFVRSPHASAKIVSVNTADAAKSKGVLVVLVGADMKAAGLKTAGVHPPLPGRGGKDSGAAVPPGARRRARLLRRRGGRHGGRRHAGAGAGRRRPRRRRLRGNPRRRRRPRGGKAGRNSGAPRRAGQSGDRLAGHGGKRRQRTRGRRHHQRRGACRPRHRAAPAADGDVDGDARRQRIIRRQGRPLRAARLLAERRHRAQPDRAHSRRRQ